ncbi:MAG TPA: SAM-dependent methyltransferase [Ohtaekwangia sp.]
MTQKNISGKIFLIPNVIADDTQAKVLSRQILEILPGINYFLVEDVRTARRFLSSLKVYNSVEGLKFEVLNKDTRIDALGKLLQPVVEGADVGIISESGCPGVADPGALAVRFAHEHGIQVIPLVGPSSLLLALMASGLNGQRFAFHGYLPIDSKEAGDAIKAYEKESRAKKQTQVFIETPYRNNQLFQTLVKNLQDQTRLCVAFNITGTDESIRTLAVSQWKSIKPEYPKAPAVFLFLAE